MPVRADTRWVLPVIGLALWLINVVTFSDYFYVAFTNSTAFSPADTLPLSRWVEFVMLVQALASLVTTAIVVAKAVNALQ